MFFIHIIPRLICFTYINVWDLQIIGLIIYLKRWGCMMYIQITTRCNMSCQHCCFSCTTQGEDMTIETFKKALEHSDIISIGGGEPTLHPKFWEFVGISLGHTEYVWMATNGSNTNTALSLATLARRGVMGVSLSQDPWHSEIDDRVINAFKKEEANNFLSVPNTHDQRGISDVSEHGDPMFAGRCDWGHIGCACSDLLVKPSGEVKGCGCDDAPTFGNVNTEVIIPDSWEVGECWQYNKEKNETNN